MKNLSPIKKMIIGLIVGCIVVSIMTANNLASVMMLVAARNTARNNAQAQTVQQGTVQQGTVSQGTVSQGTVQSGDTSSDELADGSGSGAQDAQQAGNNNNDASADKNTGDAVKMYVTALNKAKSSAKKVVHTKANPTNYNDHVVIDGNSIIKATLEPIGKSLMGTFMKESAPNEEIAKTAIPPAGVQCKIDSSSVKTSSVKKSGDKTIVTIVLNGEKDPKAGSGLGSAVSIIEDKTITDAVAGAIEITDIHLDYYECTLVGTLDKNGNLVELNITAPCILKLKTMGINAEVGINCYDEYVISY